MSAVAAGRPRATLGRIRKAWEHYPTTRFFTMLCAWLMPAALIFGGGLAQRIPLQIHPVVFLSLVIVCWAWAVRGPMAIARTPVDNFFMAWIVLAVCSQIWAQTALNRVLQDNDFIEYSKQIFTGWFMYRASYAIGAVDPKTATNSFLRSIVFFAAVACVIGLLQSRGPLQVAALQFAGNYGWNPDQVLLGSSLESPRPVGMFSGPNFFAFINLIASAIIVGITLGTGKRMKEIHSFVSTLALGLFFAGSFVAQSRIALVMHALLIAIYLFMLARSGKGRVFIFAIVGMVLTGVSLFAVKGNLDFDYLTSVFQTGLGNDESYLIRKDAVNAINRLAPDLAPLGAAGNRFSLLLLRTGDRYAAGNGPDNAFLQGFLDHGIPGVLHILYLLWGLYWGIRMMKSNGEAYIDRMRYVGILTLIFLILYSVSASRHQKPETGGFIWMIFGPIWATAKVQEVSARFSLRGRRIVVRRRRRRGESGGPATAVAE